MTNALNQEAPKNLTPVQQAAHNFKHMVASDGMAAKLRAVAPASLNLTAFMASATKYISGNEKLLQKASTSSLLMAVFDACKNGMFLDGRESFISVYNGEAQFQTMYKGNARRAGFKKFGGFAVHLNDEFELINASNGNSWNHKQARGDRGAIECFIGWAIDQDDFVRVISIGIDRVNQIADKEKTKATNAAKRYGKKASGPWFDSFERMGIKHAVNVLCNHVIERPEDGLEEFEEEEMEQQEVNITPEKPEAPGLTKAQLAIKAMAEREKPTLEERV